MFWLILHTVTSPSLFSSKLWLNSLQWDVCNLRLTAICHWFNLFFLIAKMSEALEKQSNGCLRLNWTIAFHLSGHWNCGTGQHLKLQNTMSFCNGLQNLSQICVVTCLMQRAATAHAQVETFVRGTAFLRFQPMTRHRHYYNTWRKC